MTMTMMSYARGPVVAEFRHIDPEGLTDRELLVALAKGQNATHDCVHRIEAQGIARDRMADDKRETLKSEMMTAIGGLETRIDIASGSVKALANSLGAQIEGGGKVKVSAPVSPMDLVKIGATVLGAFGGVILAYQVFAIPVVQFFAALHERLTVVSP